MNRSKIIISLTTIPSRINDIEPVLNSLVNQSVKPDKVYINVPKKYNRFKEVIEEPSFIKEKFSDKVELFYIDQDYGPASKFIGSLFNKEIKKEDILVITDDDVVKTKTWLKMLLDNHLDNRVTSFVERQLGNEIIWGYLGYIFKRKLFNLSEILEFFNKVKSECYLVDDHWFTGFCHYKKIMIYNIPVNINDINNLFVHGGSKESLVNIGGYNSRGPVSDRCRRIIKKNYNTEFPFWCCLGCCKFGKPIDFSGKNKIESFINLSSKNRVKKYLFIFSIVLIMVKYFRIKSETIIAVSASSFLVYNYILKADNRIENFQSTIPKKIIQTYYDKSRIPDKVFSNLKKFAPDYKQIIFDDLECIDFIKKYFNSSVLDTFNKFKGAHKADLFRYCYLYKFGGVYLDIKTELIMPLNQIFNENYTYTVISVVKDSIYQGIIATLPENPIFLKLIHFMIMISNSDKPLRLEVPHEYIIFTKDFWNNVYRECNMRPFAGINKNIDNPKFNYQLFQEKCTKDK